MVAKWLPDDYPAMVNCRDVCAAVKYRRLQSASRPFAGYYGLRLLWMASSRQPINTEQVDLANRIRLFLQPGNNERFCSISARASQSDSSCCFFAATTSVWLVLNYSTQLVYSSSLQHLRLCNRDSDRKFRMNKFYLCAALFVCAWNGFWEAGLLERLQRSAR